MVGKVIPQQQRMLSPIEWIILPQTGHMENSDFNILADILVLVTYSPFISSIMDMFSAFDNCSIMVVSGRDFPSSQSATVLAFTPMMSASSPCDRFFLWRSSLMI